jgi:hypothetical protein
MASLVSSMKQISTLAANPATAMSPTKVVKQLTKTSDEVPPVSMQVCSRTLWTYLVLGLILLAVCFYFFALSKSDVATYIGTRPDGFPGFVDNPWFIYVAVSIVGVLFVYGMYRGYMAAGTKTTKLTLNIVFGLIAVLIVIWFYQFYINGKINACMGANGYSSRVPFFIAISILVLLVVQFVLLWNTGDRLAAYTVIPLLVAISLFTWASWELSTGTEAC